MAARPDKPAVPRRMTRGCDRLHPVYELDLWMMDSDPLIWRSIAVPAEFDLDQLHAVIQCVMPWENCHLHQFQSKRGRRLIPPPPEGSGWIELDDEEDTEGVTLREMFDDLKTTLVYEYDFGDGWMHKIKLIATHAGTDRFAQLPVCLAGARAAPPEDCGGMWGYAEKLQILAKPDRNDSWHCEVVEYMGDHDPEAFDLKAVNAELARMFAPRRSRKRRRP